MEKARKLRVLVAKPGPDGHDWGIRRVALAFCDAGFEVIYAGCNQSPEHIVSAAIQEDVDLIGLSTLPGEQGNLFPRVMELLRDNEAKDISVVGEGVFPSSDIPKLKEIGIKEIFNADAELKDITDWVCNNIKPRPALRGENEEPEWRAAS